MPLKPMLAKDAALEALTFPVVVQPKLDGIRATVQDGVVYSRTLKRIPNASVQAALGRPEFEGLDGELIVGDPTSPSCYRDTSSFVMSESKTGADWTFYVFDVLDTPQVYRLRRDDLATRAVGLPSAGYGEFGPWPANVKLVAEQTADNADELERMESLLVSAGHEGAILRLPNAPYKHGRSTPRGPLLKVKRFVDFECVVLDVYEELHNGNVGFTNELGRTARSTSKDGKTGKGTLGGLVVTPVDGSVADPNCTFRVGTGFDAAMRRDLWETWHHPDGLGRKWMTTQTVAKVKSFPIGVKDKPRHPVFLGWRDLGIDG